MFVDEATVNLKSGDGGGGCSSFRREKFIPDGGPDGGNGGDGGNIIVIGDRNQNTLSQFKYKKHFNAECGKSGSGRLKRGHNGADVFLHVPLGTQIIDYHSNNILYDVTEDGKKIVLIEGGRGGRGNATYKSSTNRAPHTKTDGAKGKIGKFIFRLKLISDIGIIGLPNAGKSTLINTITNTKSVVGDYPFTTTKPVLGVLEIDYKQYVLCDIPGLIEGASENIGLGHEFLRHIERCGMIVHLIDANSENIVKDYKIILSELKKYNPEIIKKKEIIVLNKADLINDVEEKIESLRKIAKKSKIIAISCFTKKGIKTLEREIVNLLK